jgi:hypothetical protein
VARGYIGYIGTKYWVVSSSSATLKPRGRWGGVRRDSSWAGEGRAGTISRPASRARRARVGMQGALDLGRLDHASPAVAFMQVGTIRFSNRRERGLWSLLVGTWTEYVLLYVQTGCLAGMARGMSIATGIHGMTMDRVCYRMIDGGVDDE